MNDICPGRNNIVSPVRQLTALRTKNLAYAMSVRHAEVYRPDSLNEYFSRFCPLVPVSFESLCVLKRRVSFRNTAYDRAHPLSAMLFVIRRRRMFVKVACPVHSIMHFPMGRLEHQSHLLVSNCLRPRSNNIEICHRTFDLLEDRYFVRGRRELAPLDTDENRRGMSGDDFGFTGVVSADEYRDPRTFLDLYRPRARRSIRCDFRRLSYLAVYE